MPTTDVFVKWVHMCPGVSQCFVSALSTMAGKQTLVETCEYEITGMGWGIRSYVERVVTGKNIFS